VTPADGHVEVRAYAELNDFLPPEVRGATVRRPFWLHQTVKDVVEAAGIPHTEVDLVVVDGESVGLDHRPAPGDRIAVYPVFERFDIGPITRVRPEPLRTARFVADVHLGRLVRLLRLFGLDVVWRNDLSDEALEEIARTGHRIVLTRDRGLLKRRGVTHGLYVRSQDPREQAIEVVRRLHLAGGLAPFTRCVRCGGPLEDVSKAEVLDRLEPLTRRHHHEFRRCVACGQVYWRGSHHDRLAALVDEIRAEAEG